jgi:peptidoglycan hydrolase CwlO-like protein
MDASDDKRRIDRLEKQQDLIQEQIGKLVLQIADVLASVRVNDVRMEEFISTMKEYIRRHDIDHQDLKNTDEALKKYIWMALGALAILSFLMPYLRDLIVNVR